VSRYEAFQEQVLSFLRILTRYVTAIISSGICAHICSFVVLMYCEKYLNPSAFPVRNVAQFGRILVDLDENTVVFLRSSPRYSNICRLELAI
jgi:hypothetical protein